MKRLHIIASFEVREDGEVVEFSNFDTEYAGAYSTTEAKKAIKQWWQDVNVAEYFPLTYARISKQFQSGFKFTHEVSSGNYDVRLALEVY